MKFRKMNDRILTWEEAVLWLKDQPDQQALVQACFYDDPPGKSAERFYRSTEWKAVQKLLASLPCGRVLDIGAGRGISSYAFARDGWGVTALEPDPSDVVGAGAIRQLIQPGLDIVVEEERGEQLPFAENSFDLVYGRAVLHHADDLPAFCREASRVLKPSGVFLFTREHVLSKKEDLQLFFDTHALHHLYRGEYAYLLTDYVEAITSAGLKVDQVLEPFGSDINLFPSSQDELVNGLQGRFRFPVPQWFIQRVIVRKMNRDDNTPGRLFSFFGSKM